jgi:glycosyltransferase involved in cell wall biosynthesis
MKIVSKVLLAHPGTQYSYHLAEQLHRLGLLYRFQTCFTIPRDGILNSLYKLMPAGSRQKFTTRIINLPADKVRSNPMLELKSFLALKRGESPESVFYRRNKAFQEGITDEDIMNSDIVIGFDTSSWTLAERCKKLNRCFILDVSIGHPVSKEKVYRNLFALYPEWKEQIQPKNDLLIVLENKEIELADTIVVPSQFVRNTYIDNGVNRAKIFVNPFGTDVQSFTLAPRQNEKPSFLFFGGLTARKGLPFLLKVWDTFIKKHPECTLILAGYGTLPEGYVLPEGVKNIGLVLPSDRQKVFDMADVFVFPSFFEGLAQVQIEASACGLPVIGSTQSGAEDLVEDSKSGFIINPGNDKDLFAAMEYFVTNPNRIKIMGSRSRDIAVEKFTWDAYGERWNYIINKQN